MAQYFRLGQADYMKNPLDGIGASLTGGRWNSKKVRMVYCSSSLSLACLEVLVHVTQDTLPNSFLLAVVDVPEKLIKKSKFVPGGAVSEREHGDKWVKDGSSLGLLVPSAVTPREMNLLINPVHSDFQNIVVSIEEFTFDKRLFRRR